MEDAMNFMISSHAFDNGRPIPKSYTCDGENVSPPLSWANPPSGTQSFALVVDDPDAPKGTFHHWAVYNIPPDADHLAEDISADGAAYKQAHNDAGNLGYGGPCPPHGHGRHHYRFRLYALDIPGLNLPDHAPCESVEKEVQGHVLGIAETVGIYAR